MLPSVQSVPGNDWHDVLALADYLGRQFECKNIVSVGSDAVNLLEPLTANYNVHVLEHDLESDKPLAVTYDVLRNAVILCLDGTGRLNRPAGVLRSLHRAMDQSPVALVATPVYQVNHDVTQWSGLLQSHDLHVEFTGLTVNDKLEMKKQTMLSVIGSNRLKHQIPGNVKVAAILTAFNEDDIIYQAVRRLLNQGIFVYVLENWSTDSTIEILKGFKGHPNFLGCERFPREGPNHVFNWKSMLDRVVEVSRELDADWFIHHDIDEIRESPWLDKSLSEAIAYVDCMGFNAIDHTLIEFYPIDNGFSPGVDHADYFRYFDFGKKGTDFIQIKAWKRQPEPVSLSASGGHHVAFPGRRVFPYKFLSRHYPYRSQSHAEKKIFRDRKSRYDPGEVAQGFHRHYDGLSTGNNFLRNPHELMEFNKHDFYTNYIVERLSGIGVIRAGAATMSVELPAPSPLPQLIEPEKRKASVRKKRKKLRSSKRRKFAKRKVTKRSAKRRVKPIRLRLSRRKPVRRIQSRRRKADRRKQIPKKGNRFL